MSGFRSLAQFDGWQYGSTGFEVLRPTLVPVPRRLGRTSHKTLASVIEADIIPRLLLAHGQEPQPAQAGSDADVVAFARHVVEGDLHAAERIIAKLRNDGASIAGIYLCLFTGAARHLGELWDEDLCDFADVTLALGNMQRLMRELARDFAALDVAPRAMTGSALLIAVPDDNHDFGIAMVRDFFQREGWSVCGDPNTWDGVLRFLRAQPCDVVGLSVSNDTSVDGLAAIIRAIRKSAGATSVKVMVGGRFFLEHPEFVSDVGADATALDGRGAVTRVSSLLDTSAMRC